MLEHGRDDLEQVAVAVQHGEGELRQLRQAGSGLLRGVVVSGAQAVELRQHVADLPPEEVLLLGLHLRLRPRVLRGHPRLNLRNVRRVVRTEVRLVHVRVVVVDPVRREEALGEAGSVRHVRVGRRRLLLAHNIEDAPADLHEGVVERAVGARGLVVVRRHLRHGLVLGPDGHRGGGGASHGVEEQHRCRLHRSCCAGLPRDG